MQAEFADWYWGDFVECSMETEDQADEPSAVWAYDLDYEMSRIAPVQLTLGWNPRPTLLQVLEQAGTEPPFVELTAMKLTGLLSPFHKHPCSGRRLRRKVFPSQRIFSDFRKW